MNNIDFIPESENQKGKNIFYSSLN